MYAKHLNNLPEKLYSAEAVRALDHAAISEFNIPGYELMTRAGNAVFNYLQNQYPLAKRILVCCGAGNNAGDGYVVARLAMKAGFEVNVVSLIDPEKLQGDAKTAWQDWRSSGHQLSTFSVELLVQSDVVVDALLGTGLQRDVTGEWAELIEQVNQHDIPVVSIDVPSGICADTGRVAGCAIQANTTLTFIGVKKGLLTHLGVEHCGELLFDDLALPAQVFTRQSAQAELLNWQNLKPILLPRKASVHKYQCGHVIILGGDKGMPGAVRMAAEAALRAGAGVVTVITHACHQAVLMAAQPEIILHPSEEGHVPPDVLNAADALLVGPGLGDSLWSRNLIASALQSHIPKVLDAGALRQLSVEDGPRQDWILTPHTGEAAALLSEESATIQNSRFTSAEMLQHTYGGHIVLKGAGSLIQSPDALTAVCPYGNPGMASAGMGDVLSGVLVSLVSQGYGLKTATRLGVCLHSLAADLAATAGQKGLLASDLYSSIRQLVNAHD